MRRQQSGQTIVGVLVVMTLVFMLAGAVSFGTSALLARQSETGDGYKHELLVESAAASAVARLGAATSPCGTAPTTISIAMPQPAPSPSVSCVRLDHVQLDSSERPASLLSLPLQRPAGTCSVTPLGALPAAANTWILLVVEPAGSGATAWVDTKATGCTAGSGTQAPACRTAVKGLSFVAMALGSCDLSHLSAPMLHVSSVDRLASQALVTAVDSTSSASLTVAAAYTTLPRPNDCEELLVFRSGQSGQAAQLSYEAPVP